MYVDLLEYLDTIEYEFGAASTLFRNTYQAYCNIPNLRAWKDHMGVVRLCSTEINQYVDTMDMVHRTDGGSIEIMPYIYDQGVKIYSDPPIFVVGYQNPKGFGEVPLSDWRNLVDDAGISDEIISKIKHYFDSHQPVNYSEVED